MANENLNVQEKDYSKPLGKKISELTESDITDIVKNYSKDEIEDNITNTMLWSEDLNEQQKDRIFDILTKASQEKMKLENENKDSIKKAADEIEKKTEEHNKKQNEEIETSNQENAVEIDKLTKLLNDDWWEKNVSTTSETIPESTWETSTDDVKDSAPESKENVDKLREELRKSREINTVLLSLLTKAKNEKNTAEVVNLKKQLKESIQEKQNLLDKFWWKLPEYNWSISSLNTKRLEFQLFWKSKEWWQTKITWPELRIRRNIMSRRRINKTVQKLNEIWKDAKAWVNYVMTRTFTLNWWKIAWWIKQMKNFFKVRDVKSFNEAYDKQVDYFMSNLKSKMEANTISDEDKKTFDAIQKRLEYYKVAYRRQFMVAA